MNNTYAVIDLGTNTFHLLAVKEEKDGSLSQIHKERIYVKLAESGIETIGEAAFNRGLNALKKFDTILKEHQVQKIKAFGTAALRTASNGKKFTQQVKKELGIDIEIIPGKEEARLIHQGVMLAIGKQKEPILIMDIGGGSVEFIIADNEKVIWSDSFPIGVAVLFRKFHHNEPITKEEKININNFLNEQLTPLLEQIQRSPLKILVGASGTFDVLEAIIAGTKNTPYSTNIWAKDFFPLYDELIEKNLEERLLMPNIPDQRADLIIVALELLRFIIEKVRIERITISDFAMKEGILKELRIKS